MPVPPRILGCLNRRAPFAKPGPRPKLLLQSVKRSRGSPMSRRHFSRLSLCAAVGALAIAAFQVGPLRAAEDAVVIPAPTADVQASDGIQTAVIAGGCFWGVQGVFQHTAGVVNAVSGYAGGSKVTADYTMVTTSDEQKKVADAYIAQLNAAKVFSKPIVTKVGPLEAFYPAEAYHQDYLTLHPNQPYIAYNDIPKVENLKKIFADNYIEKPTLVSSAKVTN